jgi:hypothetical protein
MTLSALYFLSFSLHRFYYCLLLCPTFAFATWLLRADVCIPYRSGPCHPIYTSNICRLTPFRYYSDPRVFPLPLTPECSYILEAMNFMCESSARLQVGPYYCSHAQASLLCRILNSYVNVGFQEILCWPLCYAFESWTVFFVSTCFRISGNFLLNSLWLWESFIQNLLSFWKCKIFLCFRSQTEKAKSSVWYLTSWEFCSDVRDIEWRLSWESKKPVDSPIVRGWNAKLSDIKFFLF